MYCYFYENEDGLQALNSEEKITDSSFIEFTDSQYKLADKLGRELVGGKGTVCSGCLEKPAVEFLKVDKYVQRYNLLNKISELEQSVTPRRLREAIITGDKAFIENVDHEIETLRKGL